MESGDRGPLNLRVLTQLHPMRVLVLFLPIEYFKSTPPNKIANAYPLNKSTCLSSIDALNLHNLTTNKLPGDRRICNTICYYVKLSEN